MGAGVSSATDGAAVCTSGVTVGPSTTGFSAGGEEIVEAAETGGGTCPPIGEVLASDG